MQTLLLIDAHALIYRFFYALPPLSTPEGKPIQAIYGLSGTLIRILQTLKPTFAAAAFDRKEQTFRKAEFADYKSHRPAAHDDLVPQFAEAHRAFREFGIQTFDMAGFEADDIIGTLAEHFSKTPDLTITILSGDLDILQLVRGTTVTADIVKTGITSIDRYTEAEVLARYELPPQTLPDYKGLVGDASDNIPGVAGVGPKTARELLKEWKTLEGIYENLPLVPAKIAQKLTREETQARLSKRLATIACNAPITLPSLADLAVPPLAHERITPYLASLGFHSLIERLGKNGA
jgi:DNA polymerase I